MPRQAHGRPLQAGRTNAASKKKTPRNRGLNALEIAERENPDEIKIRSHRLGQIDDDDNEDPRSRADAEERSSKRRKIDITREDEVADEGSDLEGNLWHEGVDDDDEDSDIDSEDAFGASDEERFADFTFRGSAAASSREPKKPRRRVDVDLDEDMVADGDDEDEDGFGNEGVDLATAWDMDDQEEQEASKKRRKHPARAESDDEDSSTGSNEEDGGQDGNESDAEDDNESAFSVSDDDGDHSRLQSFVNELAGGDRAQPKKERRIQSLPDKPSQFGLSSTKISAADLLQYIKDPRQRQSLKILQSSEARGHEPYQGGVPGKLAPPLAKRQQDRLDRSAAYDETKKELGKWIDTVKQNRRAEHLSFPLVDAAAAGMLSGKQLGPTSTAQPMTDLESTIQSIMIESGMLSKDGRPQKDREHDYEELHEKQMPLAEVRARRAELRRQRDLLFREEIRARRIKKIKSKAYRRVHRKEREKADEGNRALLDAQGLLNSDEEREKNDRRRAEERMGARHRESKWAKSVKLTGRAAWDDDARHGVTDLARRDEELRRRVEGKTDAGSEASDSESSDFGGFSGSDGEREHIRVKLDELDAVEPDTFETRLGSMAFMKKAEAARKAANEEEMRDIRRNLRGDDCHDSADEADTEEEETPVGRQKFGPTGKEGPARPQPRVEKSEFEERESEDELEDVDDKDPAGTENSKSTTAATSAPALKVAVQTKRSSDTPGAVPLTGGPLHPGVGNGGKTRKASSAAARETAKSLVKIPKVSETQLDDYTSSSGSEDEQDEKAALAHAIFAGSDEVQREFAKEKKETVEEEGDQVIDNSLPGWGNWAGEGISKKAQKRAKGRFVTTIKGVARDKRQDVKLDKVIVNEKRVKKNSKYLASELPHPFESRQQYERSLRLPLGPEWTTKTTFQDATKPRVLVKQGVIRPMAKPMA
jgi:U3 small nucleolar RNA-associated protein 14